MVVNVGRSTYDGQTSMVTMQLSLQGCWDEEASLDVVHAIGKAWAEWNVKHPTKGGP